MASQQTVGTVQPPTLASLQWALERILAADEAIKTGRCSDREALDILLAELIMARW